MGLAERCDAIVIVVSEERGQVSLAHGGEIAAIQSPEELAQRVRELRASPAAGASTQWRRILLADLPLKAVALGLAGLLWSASPFAVPSVEALRRAALACYRGRLQDLRSRTESRSP